MDPIVVLLGLLAAGGAGMSVWLALGRGRLAAEAAAARAESASRLEYVNRLQGAWDEREAEVLRLRERAAGLEADLRAADERHRGEMSRLSAVFDEKEAALEQREKELRDWVALRTEDFKNAFGKLSGDALRAASGEFLKLAEERMKAQQQAGAAELEKRRAAVDDLVKPIAETLKKTDEKLAAIQGQWATDRGALAAELKNIGASGELLRSETGRLVRALSKPEVRGRYGEIQLRRVAELAGMKEYCDFSEQEGHRDGEGRLLKPDMIVKLPNERVIAVDAKTNTYAYVEAVNAASEEEREGHLERFARHVHDQVGALSKKQYWAQLPGSPEFVVMFMPGDQFLDAALARQPELIEQAAMANVLIATPSTLIGLLRAVAVGWREKRLDQAAAELFTLGKELHERAVAALSYADKLGGSLAAAVDNYNRFVGSYERRLEPTLRKFEAAGARSGKELPAMSEIEARPREVTLPTGLLGERSAEEAEAENGARISE